MKEALRWFIIALCSPFMLSGALAYLIVGALSWGWQFAENMLED